MVTGECGALRQLTKARLCHRKILVNCTPEKALTLFISIGPPKIPVDRARFNEARKLLVE